MTMSKDEMTVRAYGLERWLADRLPAQATNHLQRILDSGRGAARLVWESPPDFRGIIATWLYWRCRAGQCSASLYRDALDAAWERDDGAVIRAARRYPVLRAMFRTAQFPVPVGLPNQIDIWRGTTGLSLETARRGISWSLRRDTACWFAMSNIANVRRDPLVIKATVRTGEFYIPRNARSEFEVVWFGGISGDTHPSKDGDVVDWMDGAKREEALTLELNAAARDNRARHEVILKRISPYGAVFLAGWEAASL